MRNIGKLFAIGILTLFLFSSTTSVFGINHEVEDNNIVFDFSFSEPQFENIEVKGDIYKRVAIDGLPNAHDFRKPCLPVKPLRILLPQGRDVKNIEIFSSEKISLGNNFNIEVGGRLVPLINAHQVVKEQNTVKATPFYSDDIFPSSLYSNLGVYSYRGFSILHVNLYPIQYVSDTGEIFFYDYMKLVIETKESSANGGFRGLTKDYALVENIVDNPSYIHTYKSSSNERSQSLETYDYVIITSNELKNSNGEYTFQDLMDYKLSKGLNPAIVTVEEIESNSDYGVFGPWGDANSSNPFYESDITGNLELFDNTQAKIRNFIRYAYTEWGTDYVLLGGDADVENAEDNIIPLRGLFANETGLPLGNLRGEEEDDIPSDVYYACLNGNYNYDCDEHFGECADRNDAASIDEADLYSEVWVGRACVDSEEEVSNFVMKTLAYEQIGSDPYISEVLFIGEYLGEQFYSPWGGGYKDLLEPYIPSQYNLDKLYDRDEPGNYWHPSDLLDRLRDSPVQIINHDGHGNENYILKMYSDDIRTLTNEKHFFIYSHSCLTGSFDNWNCWYGYVDEDCIAEILTAELEYGAYACILNARYGLGSEDSIESPSGAYDESFFKALFTEDIKALGHASHYSKEDNVWRIDENGMRWCYYQTNLFGDPELNIKDPGDIRPDKPTRPTGPTNGQPGEKYTYCTSTTDPDGDDLYYWWDWDDGTNGEWVGPFASGEIACADHIWEEKGSYDIIVKAKNEDEMQSEWSDPLSVTMPRSRLMSLNIMENFQRLLPLLRYLFGM